jgi:hypothetical protein
LTNYRAYRWALVISFYIYPDADQLAEGLAQQFINPTGIVAAYPHVEWPPYLSSPPPAPYFNDCGERENCLFYPNDLSEGLLSTPGPYSHGTLNYPYWFIEGEPPNLAVEQTLMLAQDPQTTLNATNGLRRGGLGNAVDFFLRRAQDIAANGGGAAKLARNLPDWNLDSDRGYGFKCWRRTGALEPPVPLPANWSVNVTYI